jgi:hypothetical protein
MNFFPIPDLGSVPFFMKFSYNIFRINVMLYVYFSYPFFYIGLGSEIRDEQILGSGSGIKHPGSATLPTEITIWNKLFEKKNNQMCQTVHRIHKIFGVEINVAVRGRGLIPLARLAAADSGAVPGYTGGQPAGHGPHPTSLKHQWGQKRPHTWIYRQGGLISEKKKNLHTKEVQ